MERFTKRAGESVVYIGPGVRYPETGDIPAEMTAGEIRAALKRLAAYEDSGLPPAQAKEAHEFVTGIVESMMDMHEKLHEIQGDKTR